MKFKWNVYNSVTKQKTVAWNVPVFRISSTRAVSWNVYNVVKPRVRCTWNGVGRTNDTQRIQYNTRIGTSTRAVVKWVVGDPTQTQIVQTSMDRQDFAY